MNLEVLILDKVDWLLPECGYGAAAGPGVPLCFGGSYFSTCSGKGRVWGGE